MSARSLLRHVFRRAPRESVRQDAMPLGMRSKSTDDAANTKGSTVAFKDKQHATVDTFTSPSKILEPFGLEDIAEEALVDTSSTTETASFTDSFTSLDLEISSSSTRELVQATLDEAKTAASSHLDTISTTLALLDALDGFSATISALKQEMLTKQEACREQIAMLHAVERAVEGMTLASEVQGQDIGYNSKE